MKAHMVFNAHDPGFKVEVFLLGLVRNESPTNYPICLEPEDCGFETHTFASVREDAKHFLAIDPDRLQGLSSRFTASKMRFSLKERLSILGAS
jgi:hypothetical protein